MMSKFVLILLFVEIMSCAGTESNVPQHNHFKLSLVWPNSYCWTAQCRATVPQYFVVKYLSAENTAFQQLTYCATNLELADYVIPHHKYDLLKYWPDLSTYNFESSKKFWKDQWKTYGSCCADVMLPEAYITNALKLRQNYNIYQILKNAGIVANGSSYSADKIIAAIKKATKVTADIVCEADTDQNTILLSEIHLCINNDGKTFIDCERVADNCDRDPIFPDSLSR